MKNEDQNNALIEACRKIDFSAESVNREKNLETLKEKLLHNAEKERENNMKKNSKKTIVLVAAVAAVLCLSMAVYGQDLVRIIKTITLGDHANYHVVEDYLPEEAPVPEAIAGQIFDEDGNVLTMLSRNDDAIYNADGQKVKIHSDGNEMWVMSDEEYKAEMKARSAEFTDMQEGMSYFICDVAMPTYLPEGYEFDRIGYFASSVAELIATEDANKYMNVYYSDGVNEIYEQIRFMDASTAYDSGVNPNAQVIQINGYDAIVCNGDLDIQIGDVMYMFFGMGNVSDDELIKIAESLMF